MPFVSIFSHPVKGVYRSPYVGRSYEEEVNRARAMDGDQHHGQYLFTRPVEQVLMKSGARYALSFNKMAGTLKYRLDEHELPGQFDYYQSSPNGYVDIVVLHAVRVPEIGIEKEVTFVLRIAAARSLKFQDMCEKHLVSVEFSEGKAFFRLYESSYALGAKFEIPLEIVS